MTLPSENPNLTLSSQAEDTSPQAEDIYEIGYVRCAIADLARDNSSRQRLTVHTLDETAAFMGCSTEQVRQLEASAFRKLRESQELILLASELGLAAIREKFTLDQSDKAPRLVNSSRKGTHRLSLAARANLAFKRMKSTAVACALPVCLLAPVTRAADRMWMDPANPPAHCPDQAETGACGLFAFAAWAQARTDVYAIPDSTIMDIYRRESIRIHGRDNAKLTIPEAFAVARANGIVPAQASCVRVYGLASVALGPLVAGYRHTDKWHATAEDGRIAEGGTVDGDHALLITGRTDDGRIWLRNSRGAAWGVNGFGWISDAQHTSSILEMWHVMLPGGARSASEAAALSLADKIGLHVRALRKALVTLGFDIPCDSQRVMAHTIARSMENQLTPEQERAKADAAMIYILLQRPTANMPDGITDEMIAAVWEALKWR